MDNLKNLLVDCFAEDQGDNYANTSHAVCFDDEEMYYYFADYLIDKDIPFKADKNSYKGLYIIELI